MEFAFSHPSAQSRATETAFEQGDAVGLYVTDASKTLEVSGNTVNNEALTFNGSAWTTTRPLYWNRGTYNVYAYYPYRPEVTSVTDMEFSVATDQRASGKGYEASDLLFASAQGVEASASPVVLQFRHIMSKLTVRLVKGEDFKDEIPDDATVYIHNVATEATVDFESGVATRVPGAVGRTVAARKASATRYSAIVVPQRMANRGPLIEVVMKGVSFLYEGKMHFRPGVHHMVSVVVDKNPEQVKIEIGGEIVNWN